MSRRLIGYDRRLCRDATGGDTWWMSGETDDDRHLQEQIDDLRRQVSANRADIDALASRADASNQRADKS